MTISDDLRALRFAILRTGTHASSIDAVGELLEQAASMLEGKSAPPAPKNQQPLKVAAYDSDE